MVDHAGFYGLGWNIDYDDQGRIRWSHSGAFALGAATAVSLLPAEQLGIVVLTNAQPIGLPEAVSRSFFDLVLSGAVEKDWLTRYGKLMAAALAPEYGTGIDYTKPPPGASPALPDAAYAGSYENDLFGAMEIAATANGLVVKLGPRPNAFAMRHFDRDVFTYQPAGENAAGPSAITFAVGPDGKAEQVTAENLDVNHQGTFIRRPIVR